MSHEKIEELWVRNERGQTRLATAEEIIVRIPAIVNSDSTRW
jgi:hypothetical protein